MVRKYKAVSNIEQRDYCFKKSDYILFIVGLIIIGLLVWLN